MPVSRWLTEMFDVLNWMDQTEDGWEEVVLNPEVQVADSASEDTGH